MKSNIYLDNLEHFFNIDFLNDKGMVEYVKHLKAQNLELHQRIVELEARVK